MQALGSKSGWLAFSGVEAMDVARLLGVTDAIPTTWRKAIGSPQPGRALTITPPLQGTDGTWVLALGFDLCTVDLDIADLSKRTGGRVQHFVTHEGVQFHVWRRAYAGRLHRSFVWAGEHKQVLEWIGEPDLVERLVGVPVHGCADRRTAELLSRSDIGDRWVLRIARGWSVDPSAAVVADNARTYRAACPPAHAAS
jgi:hypothetical protein